MLEWTKINVTAHNIIVNTPKLMLANIVYTVLYSYLGAKPNSGWANTLIEKSAVMMNTE